jgi:hypothetical protein
VKDIPKILFVITAKAIVVPAKAGAPRIFFKNQKGRTRAPRASSSVSF